MIRLCHNCTIDGILESFTNTNAHAEDRTSFAYVEEVRTLKNYCSCSRIDACRKSNIDAQKIAELQKVSICFYSISTTSAISLDAIHLRMSRFSVSSLDPSNSTWVLGVPF